MFDRRWALAAVLGLSACDRRAPVSPRTAAMRPAAPDSGGVASKAAARASTGVPEVAAPDAPRAHFPSRLIDGTPPYLTLPPNTLSLTFDDGPDEHTRDLAEFLFAEGIRATFFVNGCRIEGVTPPGACPSQPRQYPKSLLTDMIAMGHRIANHTMTHESLLGASRELLDAQLSAMADALAPVIRDGVYLFRPPYGHWDGVAAANATADSRLQRLVGPIGWDVGGGGACGGDWQCAKSGNSPEEAAAGYVDHLAHRPDHNGILIIHDRNEFAVGTDYARRLVEELLKTLPRPLYLFVPLDALPGDVFHNPPPSTFTPDFGDRADGGGLPSPDGGVHFADVDGDAAGRADVCARDSAVGIRCAVSTGSTFTETRTWLEGEFTDASGFREGKDGHALAFADLDGDGKADVCGRVARGLRCARSSGHGFEAAGPWSTGGDFSDRSGFGTGASKDATVQLADVTGDGKADACGLTERGISCAASTGSGFARAKVWSLPGDFAGAAWRGAAYAATITFGDVNGDHKADVCGRGPTAVTCSLSSGSGFTRATPFTPPNGIFSDKDGWGSAPKSKTGTAASKFRSIHLADVDADGHWDLCGRNETGVVCALSASPDGAGPTSGGTFGDYRYVVHDEFTDALGWSEEALGGTVQYADVDGDGTADVCGRSHSGVRCVRGLFPPRAARR